MAGFDPRLARSRLEALLSIGSGIVAEPAAGIAGLYGAATGGSGEGVRLIDKVRNKLTYQPRDPRGLQEIGRLVAPVANALERGRTTLGDAAFNATGSPALGTAAYTAPDALLSLLGARPALSAGRSASEGIGRLVRHVDARNMAPRQMHPQSGMIAYHGGSPDFRPENSVSRFGGFFVREGRPSGYGAVSHEMDVKADVLELDRMAEILQGEHGIGVLKKSTGVSDDEIVNMVSEALTDGSNYPTNENVWRAIGAIDEADAQLEIQRLRGRVAKELGFKAVRTPDEFDGDTIMVLDPSAVDYLGTR